MRRNWATERAVRNWPCLMKARGREGTGAAYNSDLTQSQTGAAIGGTSSIKRRQAHQQAALLFSRSPALVIHTHIVVCMCVCLFLCAHMWLFASTTAFGKYCSTFNARLCSCCFIYILLKIFHSCCCGGIVFFHFSFLILKKVSLCDFINSSELIKKAKDHACVRVYAYVCVIG